MVTAQLQRPICSWQVFWKFYSGQVTPFWLVWFCDLLRGLLWPPFQWSKRSLGRNTLWWFLSVWTKKDCRVTKGPVFWSDITQISHGFFKEIGYSTISTVGDLSVSWTYLIRVNNPREDHFLQLHLRWSFFGGPSLYLPNGAWHVTPPVDVVLTWCGNDIEAARALASEVSAGDFFIWDVTLKPILLLRITGYNWHLCHYFQEMVGFFLKLFIPYITG